MNSHLGDKRQVANFGGNQRWSPYVHWPSSEAEVLGILRRHPGSTVKAVGAGHSWSDIGAHADVAIDMSALDSLQEIEADGVRLVRVGAGCRLGKLLDYLYAAGGRTLPTIGAITRQRIAGAISTGTHGSGKPSLSHFVVRVRAAVFNPETGEPEIRDFDTGPELQAVRCGLGCLGIILSVDLPTVPEYRVAETVRLCADLDEAMALFEHSPLTAFAWSPYSWTLIAFERRAMPMQPWTAGTLLRALGFRLSNLLTIDILLHLLVLAVRPLGLRAVKAFFRMMPRTTAKGKTRIDRSRHALTNNHDYFRHEEMEIFVREADLGRAMHFLRAAVETFADKGSPDIAAFTEQLAETGLADDVATLAGSYVQHYPLYFRRVLPDDTMVSMASPPADPSRAGPIYSISLFTYDPPQERAAYYAFCALLARALVRLVGARFHWGKHLPLSHGDLAPLYPRLDEFRALCRRYDPKGVFRNAYSERVLGLPPGSPQ